MYLYQHTHTYTDTIQFGTRMHRRVSAKKLQTGPSARRGKPVPLRGRCVSCYAEAPLPESGYKIFMSNGKSITQTTLACDVCRVLLCRNCFLHVYDHHKCGQRHDTVILSF